MVVAGPTGLGEGIGLLRSFLSWAQLSGVKLRYFYTSIPPLTLTLSPKGEGTPGVANESPTISAMTLKIYVDLQRKNI